jgi:hypothetical protein
MQLETMTNEELLEIYDRLSKQIKNIEQQYEEVLPNMYVTRALIKDILFRRDLSV